MNLPEKQTPVTEPGSCVHTRLTLYSVCLYTYIHKHERGVLRHILAFIFAQRAPDAFAQAQHVDRLYGALSNEGRGSKDGYSGLSIGSRMVGGRDAWRQHWIGGGEAE